MIPKELPISPLWHLNPSGFIMFVKFFDILNCSAKYQVVKVLT